MARSPREVLGRAAASGAMPISTLVPVLVPTLVLLALAPGTAAAPFTIVANVRSQTMVHVGGGAFFPQPQVDVQCPDMPGLQCRSQVDGHRIIINVFHSMTQGDDTESGDETYEENTTRSDFWRLFGKPDRVSEVSNEISVDSEDSEMKKVISDLSTTEKSKEYEDSESDDLVEEDNQTSTDGYDSEQNTEASENDISDVDHTPKGEDFQKSEYYDEKDDHQTSYDDDDDTQDSFTG